MIENVSRKMDKNTNPTYAEIVRKNNESNYEESARGEHTRRRHE